MLSTIILNVVLIIVIALIGSLILGRFVDSFVGVFGFFWLASLLTGISIFIWVVYIAWHFLSRYW